MITSSERETIIPFNECESECEVYTYNKKLINKLKKRCKSHSDIYRLVDDDKCGGLTFSFPKKNLQLNFSVPMSESRKKAVAEHLEYARSKIGSKSTAKYSDSERGKVKVG